MKNLILIFITSAFITSCTKDSENFFKKSDDRTDGDCYKEVNFTITNATFNGHNEINSKLEFDIDLVKGSCDNFQGFETTNNGSVWYIHAKGDSKSCVCTMDAVFFTEKFELETNGQRVTELNFISGPSDTLKKTF